MLHEPVYFHPYRRSQERRNKCWRRLETSVFLWTINKVWMVALFSIINQQKRSSHPDLYRSQHMLPHLQIISSSRSIMPTNFTSMEELIFHISNPRDISWPWCFLHENLHPAMEGSACLTGKRGQCQKGLCPWVDWKQLKWIDSDSTGQTFALQWNHNVSMVRYTEAVVRKSLPCNVLGMGGLELRYSDMGHIKGWVIPTH